MHSDVLEYHPLRKAVSCTKDKTNLEPKHYAMMHRREYIKFYASDGGEWSDFFCRKPPPCIHSVEATGI
jgi:hypothetical protein